MSEIPFYQTRAGRIFYEVHVPKLIEAVERLAEAVEKLAEQHEQNDAEGGSDDGK
jgi:predicted ATP-grasp superfamily ATP-dependent carboligase